MYDLSGLAYRMWSSLSLFAAGVVLLLLCWRDPRKKHQRGTLILGIGAMILSVLFCGFYWLKVQPPRSPRLTGPFAIPTACPIPIPSITALPFSPSPPILTTGRSISIWMSDPREIFPDELVEGELYRIYYEETCNVIVRIDVLASPEE